MSDALERLDVRRPPVSPDGVDAYMVVRNEAVRLPEILEHHRRLGVERFLVVDNASDDGTADLLLAQDDCMVFHTSASFGAARCGMEWINLLMAEHARGRWCLFVDADELFVYPHSDAFDLPRFCAYLESTGAEGVFALMLDMYGSGPLREARYPERGSLLETCPFHDSDYRVRRKVGNPISRSFHNVEAVGGPRLRTFYADLAGTGVLGMTFARAKRALRHSRLGARLGLDGGGFGLCPPDITKIPLIKSAPGRIWTTNHRTTPLRLSPVTGALLHFKLLADFDVKARVEAARAEHWGGGSEYLRYAAMLERDPDMGFMHAGSSRYGSPDDLVRHAIMHSTDHFDAHVAAASARAVPPSRMPAANQEHDHDDRTVLPLDAARTGRRPGELRRPGLGA